MKTYLLDVKGEQRGPYSLKQLQSMWNSGAITTDAQYWTDDSSAWRLVHELLEPDQEHPANNVPSDQVQDVRTTSNTPPPLERSSKQTSKAPTQAKESRLYSTAKVVATMAFGLFLLNRSCSGMNERAEMKKRNQWVEDLKRQNEAQSAGRERAQALIDQWRASAAKQEQ